MSLFTIMLAAHEPSQIIWRILMPTLFFIVLLTRTLASEDPEPDFWMCSSWRHDGGGHPLSAFSESSLTGHPALSSGRNFRLKTTGYYIISRMCCSCHFSSSCFFTPSSTDSHEFLDHGPQDAKPHHAPVVIISFSQKKTVKRSLNSLLCASSQQLEQRNDVDRFWKLSFKSLECCSLSRRRNKAGTIIIAAIW